MAHTIEQVEKELSRLNDDIRNASADVKEAKQELATAKALGDKAEIGKAQAKLDAAFQRKDKAKSDWYLMNAEKMELERKAAGQEES